ncbi:MAG: alpha/beta hydrolase [Desulfuromonas sp.]|nr:MAG: alpha/beta hydrolase [Desulfuromonas sp.]
MQLKINESTIHYDDLGKGPAVVLIHGFPLSRQMWAPQVEPLIAAGYRLILPDLRGFGDSEGGGRNVAMDVYADDLIGLLDYLEIERAVVGGMSMGGYVLMNLLERYPDRISGAMFLVTRAAADDEAGKQKRDELIDAVETGRKALVAETFVGVLFADETADQQPELVAEVRQWMEAVTPQGLIGGLAAMRERPDYADRLDRFRLPALVLGADQDKAIPLEHYRTLVDGLPDAEGVLIAGGGHMVNMEMPEVFNQAILRFLARF